MAFRLDNSTLINSDPTLEPERSSIPPNNYLWKSPFGQALPGWHHQLILRLLSLDQSWICKPELGFSTIRLWLRDFFPAYVVSEPSIRAIAAEYVELDEELVSAYRESSFNPVIQSDSTWERLIDPALFIPSSNRAAGVRQPHTQKHTTTQTLCSVVGAPEADYQVRSLTSNQAAKVTSFFTKSTAITHASDNESTSAHGQDIASTFHYSNSSTIHLIADTATPQSTPLGKTTIAFSPPTPEANRIMSRPGEVDAMMSEQPSPMPKNHSQLAKSGKEPSADGDLVIDEENAKEYAPPYLNSLVDLGYQRDQLGMVEISQVSNVGQPKTTKVSEELSEASKPMEVSMANSFIPVKPQSLVITPKNSSNKINLPKPDPTKYVQTSRNHWKIPQSEAVRFVAHLDAAVDPIPDRIEGYFWYCEECYDPKQDKDIAAVPDGRNPPMEDCHTGSRKRRKVVKKVTGGPTKGKFSGKRSVEKHIHDAHKIAWKCDILPEPERGAGLIVLPAQIEVHADAEMQGFQSGQGSSQSHQSTSTQPPNPDLSDEETDLIVKPDFVRRKLFAEMLADREPEPKQGSGKQAVWEQMLTERRDDRRLSRWKSSLPCERRHVSSNGIGGD